MNDWIDRLRALVDSATPVVLVSVASVKGSAPRTPGTKMLVTAADVFGTIGGGHLEYTAIDIARGQLDGGDSAKLRRFPLGASLGQCCGGVVSLLFEPIASDAKWLSLLPTRDSSDDCVVVTTVHGDAQRGKLIVGDREMNGTLGSIDRDAAATAMARKLLVNRGPSHIARVDAGAHEPASCFFDLVRGDRCSLALFGAGHVGRAIANVLSGVPVNVAWIDTRDDAFPAAIPDNVRAVVTDLPECEVDASLPDSMFLVMTHDHALDLQLAERILRRGDFAYFGLIGSMSKRLQFERRLRARGIDRALLDRMTCPIGVDGIGGKEPGVIAIAVAAELLRVMERAEAVRERPGTTSRDADAMSRRADAASTHRGAANTIPNSDVPTRRAGDAR